MHISSTTVCAAAAFATAASAAGASGDNHGISATAASTINSQLFSPGPDINPLPTLNTRASMSTYSISATPSDINPLPTPYSHGSISTSVGSASVHYGVGSGAPAPTGAVSKSANSTAITPTHLITVGGKVYPANSASAFVIGGQTATPGGAEITVSGTKISVAPGGQTAVVAGSSQSLGTAATSTPAQAFAGGAMGRLAAGGLLMGTAVTVGSLMVL